MPVRTAVLALALVLVGVLTAGGGCPPANGNDAAACDARHPNEAKIARCAADAQTSETCADRTTAIAHASYLTRAASEWRKAAIAAGSRTAQARRRLAHAMVLDERVQDDPNAPLALRQRAKHDEQLARDALSRR